MVNLDTVNYDEFGLEDDEPDELDFFDKEYQETVKTRRCLINPNGKCKRIFDHIVLLGVIYVATFSAFKLGFVKMVESVLWTPADYTVDFVFFCDIVLTFFTPRIIDNELVDNHSKLACKYLRLWFWLDLISILPFEFFLEDIITKYKIIASITKVPRIYKLFSMVKLLRTYKSANQADTVVSNLISRMIKSKYFTIKIIPLYALVLFFAHVFTCIWYYISDTDDPRGWINISGYRNESLEDRYWASMYFVYTTLTTTGYGDIVPGTKWEYVWTIILMGLGVTLHSMIYTYMLSIFQEMNKLYEDFSVKKELLLEFKK